MTSAPHHDVRVGPYRLQSPLGEGGMGVVHLALAPDGRRVALKVLRDHVVGDTEARERLTREVSTLRRINSPRVAEVIDADTEGPVPYVVTRYVPGLSLYHHVAEEGVLTGRDLLHAMTCLADALAAVHAVGVLHRDVKPTNVLMEGRAPVLIDFGLAKLVEDARLTQTGWLMGTPGYLAPEVLYGEDATAASDVHAWAATLAFGALGRSPYGTGPAMAVMDRVRRGEHDLAAVPQPARDLLAACMSPEPHDRPALREITAHLADLQRGAGAAPVVAAPGGEAELWTRPMVAPAPPEPPTEEHRDVERPTSHEATPYQQPPAPVSAQTSAQASDQLPPYRSQPDATAVLPAQGGPADRSAPAAHAAPWGPSPPADQRPAWLAAPPVRDSPAVRAQQVLQLLGLGLLAGATVAYAPYLGTALVALVVLVLRTVSLGRQRHARRVRLRGWTRWWDVPLAVVSSPGHAAAAAVGTVAGVVLAALVGLAMFSVGFLAGQEMEVRLLLAGAGFVPMLWWGPGSSRLRETTHATVRRTSRSEWGGWLLAAMAVVGAIALLSSLLATGPTWAPAVAPPLY